MLSLFCIPLCYSYDTDIQRNPANAKHTNPKLDKSNSRSSKSMKSALARRSHMLLTRSHHLSLLSNLLQSAQHNTITRRKPVDHVLDLRLFAELLHESLQFAQIVARDAREQVVHCLELQAAVDEI
jgi:hypothetical protein